MAFGKIRRSVECPFAAKKRAITEARPAQPEQSQSAQAWWQPIDDLVPIHDQLLNGKDWTDLAVLLDIDTRLGRAVRTAQRYFSDEDIVAAMNGNSKLVTLTVVDAEPVFANAAMISEILMGRKVNALAA